MPAEDPAAEHPAAEHPGAGLDERPLASAPWADEAYRALLRDAVPIILELLRPHTPRLLFLGGSASLGEAAAWETEDGRGFLLSDLDLGVVTADSVPPALRRELGERLSATAGRAHSRSNHPAGLAPVPKLFTLGFYELRYLDRHAPTLGLVDLVRHALVLWGDAGVLRRILAPPPDRIPWWEGVRLVGNRALELLQAPSPQSGESARRFYLHALAKAATGFWTARLVIERRYQPGWGARAALLPGEAESSVDPVVSAARLWSPFLSAPSEARVPPAEAGLPLYRRALAHWLHSLPPGLRVEGDVPEAIFLGEPCGVRHRFRLWRQWLRPVDGSPGGPPEPRWWTGFLDSTPDGRRMAAAALYWRLMPEGAECNAWSAATRRLLGSPLPSGPDCRTRLLSAL